MKNIRKRWKLVSITCLAWIFFLPLQKYSLVWNRFPLLFLSHKDFRIQFWTVDVFKGVSWTWIFELKYSSIHCRWCFNLIYLYINSKNLFFSKFMCKIIITFSVLISIILPGTFNCINCILSLRCTGSPRYSRVCGFDYPRIIFNDQNLVS